jgi:hypothetical protein
MRRLRFFLAASAMALSAAALGCGSGTGSSGGTNPGDGPLAGNPDGHCDVPGEADLEDTSKPTTVVGKGTPESCTGDAFVAAVAKGGVITFDCGPDPVTITLTQTAKVFNDANDEVVIDGGGKVTLSGGGSTRILYQNTCDQDQHWTTDHCNNQETPKLTVQNLTFVDGNAENEDEGGGAIFVRGGRFKINNCRFFNNVCVMSASDIGGGAVRVFDQFDGKPVYVVQSTFGGKTGLGNVGANGGALSSIGVSWTVINSLFSDNQAVGHGANSGDGGNGGAIYNDGNTMTLSLCGVKMTDNTANEGGGAIFFVSNDMSGSLEIKDSVLSHNPSLGFESPGYPGIYYIAKSDPDTSGSTLTK